MAEKTKAGLFDENQSCRSGGLVDDHSDAVQRLVRDGQLPALARHHFGLIAEHVSIIQDDEPFVGAERHALVRVLGDVRGKKI